MTNIEVKKIKNSKFEIPNKKTRNGLVENVTWFCRTFEGTRGDSKIDGIDRSENQSIMEGCKERARKAGLNFQDETLEYIVTNRDLIELTPKLMIPTLYDYWVHDVEVLREKADMSYIRRTLMKQ